MLRKRSELWLAWVVFLVALYAFGNPRPTMAQAQRTVVVVTDASDEDAFKRLGNRIVEVELLVVQGIAQQRVDYDAWNKRAIDLRDVRFLFYREDTECAVARFWQHRLTAANPNLVAHQLCRSRPGPAVEQSAERASAIHKALLVKFPNQRAQLDANLKSELHRLSRLRAASSQLASVD